MRAVVITANGGPEVLELREEPEPEPAPGKLVVALEAAGVNFRDVYEREGRLAAYANTPPLIGGVEGAGTVVEGGEGVSPGDRVCWVAAPGSSAERVLVDASRAVPVPDGVSSEQAAAVILQGMTAQYLCTATYPVPTGDDVLIHAAAGGVGLLLTQMVKRRGGRVIATTSSEDKAQQCDRAGADETIGYEGFAERVRELTGGRGVALVFDSVGRTTFPHNPRAPPPRRHPVPFGAPARPPRPPHARGARAG